MGMMAKMRSLAPWFIITVGGLFVLFMVLSDSQVTSFVGQRSNSIGEVNGEEITYQQFSSTLDRFRQFQIQNTGREIPDNQMEQFRDQVWESMVSQILMEQKIGELGLIVTDDEIKNLLLGPNPPQSVTQYFIDSTGNFNRQAYEAAIYNPQNREAVLQIEDQVREQLLQEKLRDYVNASVLVSNDEIKRKFIDDNTRMNADYVLVDISTISDSLAAPTDDELQAYYEEHKEEYKIDETRKIKYVLFRTVASKGDTTGIISNLNAIIEKLEVDTSSFNTYDEIYSDQPYSKDTVQLSQIPEGAQDLIANAETGNIVGPVLTNEGYNVYRIVDNFRSKNQLVKASHILINLNPADPNDNKEAMEIYKQLKSGADFATLAKDLSQDPGSAVKGGDLGWFGKGQMVKEFEKTAFKGKVGVVQKPVSSQFGWHIIKVTGKTNRKYVVEKIVNKIEPSASTMDRIFEDANDFQYLSEENSFETEAAALDYDIIETTGFGENARAIPGLGSNRALVVYTFESGVGDVGQAFKIQSGYVVPVISEITPEGYRPLDEVEASIKSKVLRENKRDKTLEMTKQIREKIGSTKDLKVAKDVYPQSKVASVNNFSSNGNIPSVGREFAFSEIAVTSPLNEVSDAFKGNKGSYIIKVTSRTEFDSTAYSLQKITIRNNILNTKKSSLFSQWLRDLKENADIVDLRYQFYR